MTPLTANPASPSLSGEPDHEPPEGRVDRGEDPSVLALRAARSAQPAWAQVPVRQRLAMLRRFRQALARDPQPVLAALSDLHQRQGEDESLAAELLPLAAGVKWLERRAVRVLADRKLGSSGRPGWLPGVSGRVRREPLGVVLVIGPSNYPLLLTAGIAAQALAAGNAVLIKPGVGGTAVASAFSELLRQAGLPAGLLGVLDESPVAAETVIARGVDHVVLTGSASTGRLVLRQLADRLTPATMELSGCDAVFVQPDADLSRVASALAFGLTFNGSATCIAPRRVFLNTEQADKLRALFSGTLAVVSPERVPASPGSRARELARKAVDDGAELVHGTLSEDASSDTAAWPIALDHVRPEQAVAQADLFAPVLCLIRVADEEAALRADALCPYALGAAVFGQADAQRLADRIQAGVVTINDVIVPTADPRIPFAPRGESGFGVTRGPDGLLALTRPKAVMHQRSSEPPHLAPRDPANGALFEAYLRMVHGGSVGQVLRGALALVNAVRQRR